MNRAYRRSKLKEQRRKNKEDRHIKTVCNNLLQKVHTVLKGIQRNEGE